MGQSITWGLGKPDRRGYVRTLRQARAAGYHTSLYFVFVDGPKRCVERVAKRVSLGGHHIPTEVIYRRFEKGIVNFWDVYRSEVTDYTFGFNSDQGPLKVLEGTREDGFRILDEESWATYQQLYERYR